MSKISVIVPIYNNEQYLNTCLDSLVNQSLNDIEIILIDDCSTDNSYKIAQEYNDNYSNIKLYKNNQNYGQGKTRNIGLDIATGEYIGFIDSDDYINPKMYENMYNGAKNNNYPDMITTGLLFVKDNSYANKDMTFAFANGRILFPNLQKNKVLDVSPSVCNKIFKRSLIGEYRFLEKYKWEDISFTTIMFLKSNSILEYNNPDYFYRRNLTRGVSSINYNPNNEFVDIFKVVDEIISMSIKLNKRDDFYNQINTICCSAILKRIDEINYWNIKSEQKEQIKEKIYQILFNKYKELTNVDSNYLQGKINYKIIDEFETKKTKHIK